MDIKTIAVIIPPVALTIFLLTMIVLMVLNHVRSERRAKARDDQFDEQMWVLHRKQVEAIERANERAEEAHKVYLEHLKSHRPPRQPWEED